MAAPNSIGTTRIINIHNGEHGPMTTQIKVATVKTTMGSLISISVDGEREITPDDAIFLASDLLQRAIAAQKADAEIVEVPLDG